jgi:hypothetical protein
VTLPELRKDFRDCHHVLEFSAPDIAQHPLKLQHQAQRHHRVVDVIAD